MDIISHGLYGGVIFGNKNKKEFWLAAAFGILPDFLAFGLPFATVIIALLSGGNGGSFFGPGHIVPNYVHDIYNVTHSLVTRTVVFGVLWLIYKKPVKASYARLLHILIDIPTHGIAFFPTPFLWPISKYVFNGIPRSNKIIFIPNIIVLVVLFSIYFYKKRSKHTKKQIIQ